ncbi:MAG TPA: sigma 54-interacting transcriptional regulator [Vicinamibacterales bacterium]|nr:sigma 54-interacting transcriptional regulator [Vicinamibacterales bacterium]
MSTLNALFTRAGAALERGRGGEAAHMLAPVLRSASVPRDDELKLRSMIAEAALLQDDLDQAAAALGRPPDTFRDTVPPRRLSTLWRLHGRLASARGDQSRAIALHGRALKQAEVAHDSRAIGLAHYELGQCYRKVGDMAIVREHITKAASALHAAGDRRHLALVHSLSSIALAQLGRYDEAMGALRQAERLATMVQADDVLATVCGNQANVMMLQHRYEQALALAERSVALHEGRGSGHGRAVAIATLGQICVRVGDLTRAEDLLHRALEIRTPIQFHETTGAVFDTLAQIHLIRGRYETAADFLGRASDAYGAYGRQTSQWYQWSVRVLSARLAVRRGDVTGAVALADDVLQESAPPFEALQATLIAAEALTAANRLPEAESRLTAAADALDPKTAPAAWGEYLRLRGALHAKLGSAADAYHDFAQSATLLDLLGERYQCGLSHLALGRLVAETGARSVAERHLNHARAIFSQLGAERDLADTDDASSLLTNVGTGQYVISPADADDAIVRRIVDAAALPELLGRETAAALLEAASGDASVVYVELPGGDVRLIAAAGCDEDAARSLARAAAHGSALGRGTLVVEKLGRDQEGERIGLVTSPRPIGHPVMRRLRMIATVARQGFALCTARERSAATAVGLALDRSLEPLLPGFLSASTAMQRVVEQIQRMQGNDLTVLITGESGTGKELVARAIHVGSHRSAAMFLPYNCTTTGRDLADSQLFGHRRGSFTGAVSDQPGLVRTAAGGTLFLDEIGDLPLDVQPKLLRFLEQSEIMPIGETRPQRVDVRVLAATNADLEQRVAEGKFREDLYYRLAVIRIHVPPLRDRREEIPHLSTYFLREACERLSKPDVHLTSEALDVFSQYWWPGNVRQLKNEIQRAVALSAPGGLIEPAHLSPELVSARLPGVGATPVVHARPARSAPNLASAVEQVERDMIQAALDHSGGNISETARSLGLTRRGLYLKLRRLGFETAQHADTK